MKTFKNPFIYLGIAAISLVACSNNDKKNDIAGTAIEDVLSKETAKRYVKNYERHAGRVEQSKGDTVAKSNTRAIWFSEARLRKLLDSIKAQGGDGIRFYLATYDKIGGTGKNAIEKTYLGYNTLVMVSTWKDGTIHRDYYGEQPGKNGAKGYIVGALPENRGEMCPPPKNCDSVGATLIDPPALIK